MCEAESEIYTQNAFPYTTNGCPDGLTILQNRAYFYGCVPLAVPLHCTLSEHLSLATGGSEYLLPYVGKILYNARQMLQLILQQFSVLRATTGQLIFCMLILK
jgi:hypothetical protein